MFHIIHIPSNGPILRQKSLNWMRDMTKYIYFPGDANLSDYWVKKYYTTAEFESKAKAKLFLNRFNKQQLKEFTIVEVN